MILGILQARMSSTRLPGKVLEPIMGRTLLACQIERVRRSRGIDRLVVATSCNPEDLPIADECRKQNIDVYRGDLYNVLDRFYQAARRYHAEHIMRLTGDCPLIDPQIVDALISFYLEAECDYASNCRPPSYPDGLDAEVFTFAALENAWRESTLPEEKEHVVVHIITHPERFKIANYRYSRDLSRLRWTVDEPEDLEFVRRVYEALYPKKPAFTMDDVLDLLDRRPELIQINNQHKSTRVHERINVKK